MTVYNHIHVDGDLDGAPENGPTNKYSVARRRRIPEVHLTVKRMANGTLRVQRLDSAGVPLIGREYEYELYLTTTEIDTLEADLGEKIYLVDTIHCADGADHTAYIEDVYFVGMSGAENLDPLLTKNRVTITLRVDL